MNGLVPSYLQELCVCVLHTRVPLRSASRYNLVNGTTDKTTTWQVGMRAFCVAGPAACNSVRTDIRTASTLANFQQHLKTCLFIRSISVDLNSAFSVVSAQSQRFFDGWDAGYTKGTPDDVVKNVMPGVFTWLLFAHHCMKAMSINQAGCHGDTHVECKGSGQAAC